MKKSLLVIAMAITLIACGEVTVFKEAVTLSNKEVSKKNYVLNRTKTVYLGDSIMKVMQYKVKLTQKGKVATPYSKYTVYDTVLPVYSGSVIRHKIIGNITHENKKYILVQVQNGSILSGNDSALLVRPNGSVHLGAIYRMKQKDVFDYTISINPRNLKFKFNTVKEYKVDEDAPNYEIIFSGVDDSKIYFDYKEYAGKSIKRPSYVNKLSINKNKKVFRYKTIKILIESVSEDKITYKIIED